MGKLIRNILYNSAYQILLVLLPLITTPYISRVLGAANIGTYAYYFTFAAYFVMFSRLGVLNYGNRSIAEVSDQPEKVNQTFSEIYGVQVCTSCLAIITYIILYFFQDNTQIYLCAGLYVLSGIFDISWLYFGLEEFKKTALRSMIVKTISVALIFILVKTPDDLVPYTIICCSTHLITNIVLWLMLPTVKVRLQLSHFKQSFHHFKSMLILFLPMVGISLYNYMDKLMLGQMATEIDELGFYQSSECIMSVPVSLIAAIGTVMLPRMSMLYQKGQTRDATHYIMVSMWLAVFVASAFAFGIIGVSPEFVSLFYGPGFERCILLLRILMVATVFVAMANVIRKQILLPKKMDKIFVLSVFCGAAINLVLNAILIPRYGSAGASTATLVSECIVFSVQLVFCLSKEPVMRFIGQSLPFVLIGMIMAVMLYFIPIHTQAIFALILKVLIGGAFYLLCSFLYYRCVLRRLRPKVQSPEQ